MIEEREKYFKMLKQIKEEKIDIVKLYILDSISVVGNSREEEKLEEWQIMDFCYDTWLEADSDMDLGKLADVVQENWDKIQQDLMTQEDIIEEVLIY